MSIFSGSSKPTPESGARRTEPVGLTIIGSGTSVVGDVESEGVVKVEGEVRGSVRAAGQILIAKGGIVRGDVLTREAVIGGEIEGTVRAEERVEIQAGAVVNGDILTQRILVADGGKVNGQISMTGVETEFATISRHIHESRPVSVPSDSHMS
jgi:cytoskeletal protein CcmA (bactofilin family)